MQDIHALTYRILVDSCGEFTADMKDDPHFVSVPLTMSLDDLQFVDDATFNQAAFLAAVKNSPNVPKSACPSPDDYLQLINEAGQDIYIITLSGKLSGSNASAQVAKKMHAEEGGTKNVHVFDSCSASIAETLIAMKVQELIEAGHDFPEVVRLTEEYIDGQNTYFVLETLEALRKNGRISNIKATIAGILSIKPVMGATKEGLIQQLSSARGMRRALETMTRIIVEQGRDLEKKILAISHCNAFGTALALKELLEKAAQFKKILILDTAGISSLYASEGGIIVTV